MPDLRTPCSIMLVCAGLLTAGDLSAQRSRLVLEASGGAAIPTGSFSDGASVGEGATSASSLSVAFVLPGAGRRGTYFGFSQHRFGCEGAGCPAEGRYVATGFDVGFRFKIVTAAGMTPWVRLGAITTRVETDDLGGANAGVSDLGFGGEVGAGIYIGAASAVAINPGVRFAFVNTDLPGGEALAMRYLVAQVALTLSF